MVKHIVLFKLKERTDEMVTKTVEVLNSMRGRCPDIIEMECGADFLQSARSYDIALAVTVASREALDAYQADEYHVTVVKKHMHAVICGSVAVDYEC